MRNILNTPVDAILDVVSAFNATPRFHTVQFEGKKKKHLVVDITLKDVYISCGLPCEGKATLWKDMIDVTCKKCLK